MAELIEPHGGILQQVYLTDAALLEERRRAATYPAWHLNPRQLCDVELLLNGAFSPLKGFLTQRDYLAVLQDMRLADGTLWPIPITLDVTETFAGKLEIGSRIGLYDPEGVLLAVMDIEDRWQFNQQQESLQVYGTADPSHPGVHRLSKRTNPVYLGGRLYGIDPITHYDFKSRRHTPAELRALFTRLGWRRVIAFHSRRPMHRLQYEYALYGAKHAEANLLIHPAAGPTETGDIDYFTRVRCYEMALRYCPERTTQLSLLPLAMRLAGPREALWHAIIRKNYGCTHFMIRINHAGPEWGGKYFYEPKAAQELLLRYEAELGMEMVPLPNLVYCKERTRYLPVEEIQAGETALAINDTQLREYLNEGTELPEWFTFPEVAKELFRSYPPRAKQGFVVFFTGLSGSGKSTIANALRIKLMELGGRSITLLDGDLVRKHLSSELGFSREHRDLNVRRIGFVAAEIARHGGIAICAPIAPYQQTRQEIKEMVEAHGGFVEIHVATSLEVCESRDRKGLYAKARAGQLKEFTGISDPYEAPENPELRIDTGDCSADEAAQRIILKLEGLGYLT